MAEPAPIQSAPAEEAASPVRSQEEQKALLIAFARTIIEEQAELVLVRSGQFKKPTHHRGDLYPMTVLERATRPVLSQSGLQTLQLRDHMSDRSEKSLVLVATPISELGSAPSESERCVFTFMADDVHFRGQSELNLLDIDSAHNYLETIAGQVTPLDRPPLPRLPRFIGRDEFFEPGSVLNLRNPEDYLHLER